MAVDPRDSSRLHAVISGWLQDIVDTASTTPTPARSPPGELQRLGAKRRAVCTAGSAALSRKRRAQMDADSPSTPRLRNQSRDGDPEDDLLCDPTPRAGRPMAGQEGDSPLIILGRGATVPGDDGRHPVLTPSVTAMSEYGKQLSGRHSPTKRSGSTGSSSRASAKRRQRSPTKGMEGLRLGQKPVEVKELTGRDELPEDVRYMYDKLREINRPGRPVVPPALGETLNLKMERVNPHEYPIDLSDPRNFLEPPSETVLVEYSRVLDEICEIVRASGKSRRLRVSEAEWNESVHSRMLRIGLKAFASSPAPAPATETETEPAIKYAEIDDHPDIDLLNTTKATISSGCIPTHSGDTLQTPKLVDYASFCPTSLSQMLATKPCVSSS